MAMDAFTALQIQALRDVLAFRRKSVVKEDPEYPLRQIFRWYSKTFHTPLHLVEDLPLEDVIRAYWEEIYEVMDEDKVEAVRVEMMKTEEERAAEDVESDVAQVDLEDLINELKEIADASRGALDKVPLEKKSAPLIEPVESEAFLRDVPMVSENPMDAQSTPDIKMTFLGEDEDLGLDEDTFGLLKVPRR